MTTIQIVTLLLFPVGMLLLGFGTFWLTRADRE